MTPGLGVSDVHTDQNREDDKGGSRPANDR
jgi:hypothetical protein